MQKYNDINIDYWFISLNKLLIIPFFFIYTHLQGINFEEFYEEWKFQSPNQEIINTEDERILLQRDILSKVYLPKLSNFGGKIYSQNDLLDMKTHSSSLGIQLQQRINGISSLNFTVNNKLIMQLDDTVLYRQTPSISASVDFVPFIEKKSLEGYDIITEKLNLNKSKNILLLSKREQKQTALYLYFTAGSLYRQLKSYKEISQISKKNMN